MQRETGRERGTVGEGAEEEEEEEGAAYIDATRVQGRRVRGRSESVVVGERRGRERQRERGGLVRSLNRRRSGNKFSTVLYMVSFIW
jgi:hypothetical protein